MVSVAIRADGGPVVGMGHIMRCLSLAEEFKKIGCRVCFLSRLQGGMDKIREKGFEAIELKDQDLNGEAGEVVDIVQGCGVQLLIVDTYRVTAEYFLKLKPHVKKLAYIDDMNQFIYPVDILVNGNITGQYLGYRKYSEKEMLLLGPEYNLIRDEFAGLPAREVNQEAREMMITVGGSDPHYLTTKLLGILSGDETLKKLRIDVVVGSAFDDRENLREISSKNISVALYENAARMSEIMLRSDIAVSGGGSTLYELCACGTPALAFIMADNQQGIVEKLDQLGYIQSLGWYNTVAVEDFTRRVRDLCGDYGKRAAFSRKMQGLVDGQGARRVAERVLELLEGG